MTTTLSELVRLQERQAPRPWTPGTGTLIHTPDSDKPDHEYTEQEKIDRRDFIIAARNFDLKALATQYEAMRAALKVMCDHCSGCGGTGSISKLNRIGDEYYDEPCELCYEAHNVLASLDTKARGDE